MVSSFRFYWHDCHPERSRRLMKIVLHRDTRRFFWSGLCWERCMEAFHFFWFQVSDFRMLNFEFFGTQIGGIGLILKISFTRLSPWAKSKANGNVLHRDARSFFEVDCVERNAWRNLIFFGFKFQVLLTRLSPWAKSKANENSFIQRCYPKNFVSKLSDCEAEAAETHVWLDFALACEYVTIEDYEKLYKEYDMILGMLVKMIVEPEKWNL